MKRKQTARRAQPRPRPVKRRKDPEPDESSPEEELNPSDPKYGEMTARWTMKTPAKDLIHKDMHNSWAVDSYFQSCLLFDLVNPVRQFKRGTTYDSEDEEPFSTYDNRNQTEVTESDSNGTLQPYRPRPCMYVYPLVRPYDIRSNTKDYIQQEIYIQL